MAQLESNPNEKGVMASAAFHVATRHLIGEHKAKANIPSLLCRQRNAVWPIQASTHTFPPQHEFPRMSLTECLWWQVAHKKGNAQPGAKFNGTAKWMSNAPVSWTMTSSQTQRPQRAVDER